MQFQVSVLHAYYAIFDDEELFPLDNVLEFLKIAIDEGVKKIRITGGESRYPE
ncbi:hypothetical protein TH0011_09220 [Helicobacter pylori]